MPPTRNAARSGNKAGTRPARAPRSNGHFSCEFCRSRKLRCDRPIPCTNCVSRGRTCRFESQRAAADQPASTSTEPGPETANVTSTCAATAAHVPISTAGAPRQGQEPEQDQDIAVLVSEVQALKDLAQNLEDRIGRSHRRNAAAAAGAPGAIQQPSPESRASEAERPYAAHTSPGDSNSRVEAALGTRPSHHHVRDVVARLEQVSAGPITRDHAPSTDNIVFCAKPIREIPNASQLTYSNANANGQPGQPTRCIWLPLREESRVIVGYYARNMGYIHHVVHHPSLPSIVDDVYDQLDGPGAPKPGPAALLLSIVSGVTYAWVGASDGGNAPDAPFASSAEANNQTALWIKATLDLLHSSQNLPQGVSLETIQAIVILIYVVANIEGVSTRCRYLLSVGLMLGRELDLHRCDHPNSGSAAAMGPLKAEMARRAWWNLVGTDWLIAARYGGPGEGVYQCNPRHMTVNKPRNVNDEDLSNDGGCGGTNRPDAPADTPTDMSYFLVRLRLAEICRDMVDRRYAVPSADSLASPSFADVMAMDAELDRFLKELPPFFRAGQGGPGGDGSDANAQPRSQSQSDSHSPPGLLVQKYMLNSLVYTQRCKLHLPYLTCTSSSQADAPPSPVYAYSRETCLASAQKLIHNEVQLESADHPFVPTRFRFSGLLYGLFMASIILLMDDMLCQQGSGRASDALETVAEAGAGGSGDGPRQQQRQQQRHPSLSDEVVEALRMLDVAQSQSLAASRLLQLLTQVQGKHFPHLQTVASQQRRRNWSDRQVHVAPPSSWILPSAIHAPHPIKPPTQDAAVSASASASAPACPPAVERRTAQVRPDEYQHARQQQPLGHGVGPSPGLGTTDASNLGGAPVPLSYAGGPDAFSFDLGQGNPSYFEQMAQNLEGLADLEDFQWDDLFTGLNTTSFF